MFSIIFNFLSASLKANHHCSTSTANIADSGFQTRLLKDLINNETILLLEPQPILHDLALLTWKKYSRSSVDE